MTCSIKVIAGLDFDGEVTTTTERSMAMNAVATVTVSDSSEHRNRGWRWTVCGCVAQMRGACVDCYKKKLLVVVFWPIFGCGADSNVVSSFQW
jgi:hypothetical protein